MRSPHPPTILLTIVLVAGLASPALAQLGVTVDLGGGGGVEVGVGGDAGEVAGTAGLPGSGSDPAAVQPDEVKLSQNEVLEAVRSKRAVPLAPIVAGLQQLSVEVIDAQLLALRGILVYEIRTIGEGGEVSELYFYARSGRRVATD